MNSEKIEKKKKRELDVIRTMIQIYCKGNHKNKTGLCEDCEELLNYAAVRIEKCPFTEEKTFCSHCKVHCYKQDMRAKVKDVMRYAGPRMLFVKPHLVVMHGYYTLKNKLKRRG